MAMLTIHDENRTLTDPAEINAYLEPIGIWYEKLDVEGRIGPNASNEEILEAYKPEIERLILIYGKMTAGGTSSLTRFRSMAIRELRCGSTFGFSRFFAYGYQL